VRGAKARAGFAKVTASHFLMNAKNAEQATLASIATEMACRECRQIP
jgi:hypothetical protein